jgi:superoxide dismutase, Cu-Zn family
MQIQRTLLAAAVLTLGLAGCGAEQGTDDTSGEAGTETTEVGTATPTANGGASASATLQSAEGQPAGTATVSDADGMIRVSLSVEGLPPGAHGAHVHTTGSCEAPAFETAGGHWNPTNAQHGLESPQGQHAGDMPNLQIGEDGRGTLEYTLEGATLAGLLDSDGSAIVVHASADDQMTDPSGNSGDRIACGVFRAQEGAA